MAIERRTCPTCGQPINRGPGQHAYCSDECRPACIAEGCDKPRRGRTEVCEKHRVQLARTGSLIPRHEWSTEWVCVVCGAEVKKGSGRRKHCSNRCQALASRAPDRPKSFDCIRCGTTVSLITPSTKAGQMKRSDSKLCNKCRWRARSNMTARQLARRDGTDCKICGDTVDMTASGTDMFRPSVDHIIPRSVGGSNDPQNLQLAHLWCNQVKNARKDFSLLPTASAEVKHGD